MTDEGGGGVRGFLYVGNVFSLQFEKVRRYKDLKLG